MNLPKPALAALIAALFVAGAGAAETAAPPRITVAGEATVKRAPDMATVSIGVTSVAATAAAALADNSAAMRAVTERLKAAGVAETDLQTTGLSVSPDWPPYDSDKPRAITGYTATNSLTVQIRRLEQLGAVLDSAVGDGANTLDGLVFGLADPRPALDEARAAAVADARARAELLAKAAGVELGPVESITEGGGYGGGPVFKAMAAAEAVPVQQGEVGYSASVTVVWQLAQ